MPFINELEKLAPLSEECKIALREAAKLKNYPKKHCLLSPEQMSDKLYYVESGLLRVFYRTDTDTDTDNRQVTAWFGREGTFVASIQSFLQKKPSNEYIELLEDSQLWVMKQADLEVLFVEFPELHLHFWGMYKKYMTTYGNTLRLLREKNAEKRYACFNKLYPGLANRAQVNHIAQFINLDANTLSKIRSKLAAKK